MPTPQALFLSAVFSILSRHLAPGAITCLAGLTTFIPASASLNLTQNPEETDKRAARTLVHWVPAESAHRSLPSKVFLHYERHGKVIEVRTQSRNSGSIPTKAWDDLCYPVRGLGPSPRKEKVFPQMVYLSDKSGMFLAFADETSTDPIPLGEIRFQWVRTGVLDLQTTFDPIGLSSIRSVAGTNNPDLNGSGLVSVFSQWFCTERHRKLQIDPYSWVLPGTYRMQLQSPYHLPQEISIDIEAGKTHTIEVHLKTPEGLTAHGRVTLPPGRHYDEIECLDVNLLSSFGSRARAKQVTRRPGRKGRMICNVGEPAVQPISWSIDKGQWIGRFQFPNVPIGWHRMYTRASVWNVNSNYLVRHDGSVEILLDLYQQTSGPGWGVDLAPAKGDAPPNPVPYGARPRQLYRWNADDSTSLLLEFNGSHGFVLGEGVPLPERWVLYVADHLPIYGDSQSFKEVGPDRFIATLQPQSGWGTTILATNLDDSPAVGAEVIVDGKVVALTDSNGHAIIERESRPKQVALRLGKRKAVQSDYAPHTPFLRLRLR